jgi:hypothetical protein
MTTVPPGRALHVGAGIVPATLTVLFAGLVALIALALDSGRRQYALDLADRFVDLASVLAGLRQRAILCYACSWASRSGRTPHELRAWCRQRR